MSDIIATDLQQLEPSSAFIDLFELTLEDGQVLYFHDGVEADLSPRFSLETMLRLLLYERTQPCQ